MLRLKKEDKKQSKYLVTITWNNTDFVFPINTLEDFKRLEEILKAIKKKIQNS